MWRGHLSKVEEIRKGRKVGEKVRAELERKYQLTERGAMSVSTFLKNKSRLVAIRLGGTRTRMELGGRTLSFGTTRNSCLRNLEVTPMVEPMRCLMQLNRRRSGRESGLWRCSTMMTRVGWAISGSR